MVYPKGSPRAGEFVHPDVLKNLPVLGEGLAERSFMISFSYRDDTTAEEMLEAYDPGEEKAAEKLQSSFRGFLTRREMQEKKAGGGGGNNNNKKKKQEEEEEEEKKRKKKKAPPPKDESPLARVERAACKLQANFRGYLARRDLELEKAGKKGHGWGRTNRVSGEKKGKKGFFSKKKKAGKGKGGGGGGFGGGGGGGGGSGFGGFGGAGGGGGGAFGGLDMAAIVQKVVTVNRVHKMLIDTCRKLAPNGKYDFAMANAVKSAIGYKKLSDSCTAAELADGEGEGCVVLLLVCATPVSGSA